MFVTNGHQFFSNSSIESSIGSFTLNRRIRFSLGVILSMVFIVETKSEIKQDYDWKLFIDSLCVYHYDFVYESFSLPEYRYLAI